jgi:hypothetical protein
MQLTIDNSELTKAVDELMRSRGYVPESQLVGRTIGIKEFAKKYCYPHGIAWVKAEILYKFHPAWVADIAPGRGRGFTIFEYPAAKWMEEHRDEIDWDAQI